MIHHHGPSASSLFTWVLKRWNVILLAFIVISLYFLLRDAGSPDEPQLEGWGEEIEGQYMDEAVASAKLAGEIILDAFEKAKQIEQKTNFHDLVTQTDKECEKAIRSKLESTFPKHKFISEEEAGSSIPELTDDPTWIIDPLDGTTNFIHSLPWVSVSIALFIKRECVVAVVYNPIMQEMFTANKGEGALRNGDPIWVSKVKELKEAVVSAGLSNREENKELGLRRYQAIQSQVQAVRRFGAASLDICSVAMGRLDLYMEKGLKVWDYASALLIAKEAGAVVSDKEGSLVVGNYEIVAKFQELLNSVK